MALPGPEPAQPEPLGHGRLGPGPVYIRHDQLTNTAYGTYSQDYWNYYDPGSWWWLANGAAPIRVASTALYSWSGW